MKILVVLTSHGVLGNTGRQADRSGLAFARRASSRDLPGRAASERKTRDRFHQW